MFDSAAPTEIFTGAWVILTRYKHPWKKDGGASVALAGMRGRAIAQPLHYIAHSLHAKINEEQLAHSLRHCDFLLRISGRKLWLPPWKILLLTRLAAWDVHRSIGSPNDRVIGA